MTRTTICFQGNRSSSGRNKQIVFGAIANSELQPSNLCNKISPKTIVIDKLVENQVIFCDKIANNYLNIFLILEGKIYICLPLPNCFLCSVATMVKTQIVIVCHIMHRPVIHTRNNLDYLEKITTAAKIGNKCKFKTMATKQNMTDDQNLNHKSLGSEYYLTKVKLSQTYKVLSLKELLLKNYFNI